MWASMASSNITVKRPRVSGIPIGLFMESFLGSRASLHNVFPPMRLLLSPARDAT